MRHIQVILILLLLPFGIFAQGNEDANEENQINNAFAIGVFGHTFGLGIDVQFYRKVGKNDLVVLSSIASQKSLKEQRITSIYSDRGGEDFFYDKKNTLYRWYLGAGISRLVIPRTQHNKVGVRFSASGGLILGLLKPYYLEVAVNSATGSYLDEVIWDASRYSYFDVFGQADFFLGINEVKAVPGASLKLSTMLDFSRTGDYIRGIEISAYTDYYVRRVDIFDEQENPFFFAGASVGILIGNAW